jgi:hypothetical protein
LSTPESSDDQADEDQIGEGERVSSTASSNLPGSSRQPRRSADEGRHEDHEDGRDQQQAGMKTARTLLGEASRFLRAAFAVQARLNSGTKPAAEGAFAEQAAEEVGDQEGEVEGVVGVAAPSTRAPIISRAKPSTRLTMVSPPIVPVALRRFTRSVAAAGPVPRPAGRGQAPDRRASLPPPAGPLRLLRPRPAHVERGEVDRIEHQRREAGVLRRVGDDLAANGKSRRGASTSRKGGKLLFGHVAEAEQAGVAQVDTKWTPFSERADASIFSTTS